MTSKQIYAALAQIAGHHCYDGKKFVVSKRIGGEHLAILQRRLMTVLEKLSYDRCINDFTSYYMEQERRPPPEGSLPDTAGVLSESLRQRMTRVISYDDLGASRLFDPFTTSPSLYGNGPTQTQTGNSPLGSRLTPEP